jgi:hypothetical protein
VHIAFLTLFLGLASGRVPVAVSVAGPLPVAAVELLLDGEKAGRLTGPAFQGDVDLGPDLLPHHLEARALDAKGVEVGRAEQWLNLPHPPTLVELAPEVGAGGRITAVRLSIKSTTHESPSAVTATLDGTRLPVAAERVTLPAYRAEVPHLLTIEARFPHGPAARRDFAFGGGLEGEVGSELTAIVVRAPEKLPAPAELASWFASGEPGNPALAVAAVEEGPGEIFAVFDPEVPAALDRIGRQSSVSHFGLHHELPIASTDRLRLVGTDANLLPGGGKEATATAIFPVSPERDGQRFGLYSWLAQLPQESPKSAPHLAEAVAVAGVRALGDQHRRAVVLLLSGHSVEASRYDPETVRHYLAALQVPLYVWSLAPPPYPPGIAAWGEVDDASTLPSLRRAYSRLSADLKAQRIVWLDGRHLPQAIALSPRAPKGIELAVGPVR